MEAQLWLPGPHHKAPQLLASPHQLGLINPSLLPGQAAEISQELPQHFHQEVCDASKVLGNVQADRDSQQHRLQELVGAGPSRSLPGSSSPGSILVNQKTRKHTPKEALKLVKPSFLLVREYEENIVDSRLLHPQHLGCLYPP